MNKLHEAADLIEKHGWIQKGMGNPSTGFCATGAIHQAHLGPGELGAIYACPPECAFADAAIRADTGFRYIAMTTWNDADERTQDEVTAKLRDLGDRFDAAQAVGQL